MHDSSVPSDSRAGWPRPTVTLQYAQTLDGRIATRTGHSQWISSHPSLIYTHQLRARHDAVLVGVGTVLRDDPQLTVRLVASHNPLRVVVDTHLRIPRSSSVLTTAPETTIIATTWRALPHVDEVARLGVHMAVLPTDANGQVDLHQLLQHLRLFGVRSILVEGGAQIITSFLRERLVDRVIISIAPKLLGAGIEAIGNLEILSLGQAIHFTNRRFRHLGDDMLFEGDVTRGDGVSGTVSEYAQ